LNNPALVDNAGKIDEGDLKMEFTP